MVSVNIFHNSNSLTSDKIINKTDVETLIFQSVLYVTYFILTDKTI